MSLPFPASKVFSEHYACIASSDRENRASKSRSRQYRYLHSRHRRSSRNLDH